MIRKIYFHISHSIPILMSYIYFCVLVFALLHYTKWLLFNAYVCTYFYSFKMHQFPRPDSFQQVFKYFQNMSVEYTIYTIVFIIIVITNSKWLPYILEESPLL